MSEGYTYTQGGWHTLARAARAARTAGKSRTYEWLLECAERWQESWDAQWPDAPAYKGAVVHVDAPGPDLKALTADQLIELGIAIDAERFERENG